MWHLVTFGILLVLSEGKLQTRLVENQAAALLQFQLGGHCDTRALAADDEILECEACEGSFMPDGGKCMLTTKALNRIQWAKCESGMWVSVEAPALDQSLHDTSNHLPARRVKRFFNFILGVVACLVFCPKGGSGSGSAPIIKKAPTYNNCPPSDIQLEYFASEGTRERKVSWSVPTASDSDGSISSNDQKSTPLNGESFQGSVYGIKHTVRYEAKDNDGLIGYCFFDFKVTVRSCNEIPRVVNGFKECSDGNIYGSICTFHCDEGYERTGDSEAKCLEDGSWSGVASCSKKRCSAPNELHNGGFSCFGTNYEYQSVCYFYCNTGFTLIGSVFIQCQVDQTWTWIEEPRCIDSEPPDIYCLTPQIFYADRGVPTASSVEWIEPTAKDNVDTNPMVIKTDGPELGARLTEERTYVSYRAKDLSGNESPECSIELVVQRITCYSPSDALNDNKLVYTCSDSLYYFGVSCTLSCDYNLPLEGIDTITCEAVSADEPSGIWEWSSDQEPYCREIVCPALDPPTNGVLARETVNQRPVDIMLCNDEFDIPPNVQNFNGKFFCYDSGYWHPQIEVPDCIKKRNPNNMRLPSEIYYYSGECSDEATQQQIKEKFLQVITTEAEPEFHSICTKDNSCTIDSVTVTCGPVGKRKRRDYSHRVAKREETHATVITFDFVTGWDQGNMTFDEIYEITSSLQAQQIAVIENLLAEGKLNITGMTLKEDSFQTSGEEFECDPGYLLDGGVCKPCPRGLYKGDPKQCQWCPVGEYMDEHGATSCKKCPEGTSTEKIGSKSLDNCTAICGPGSYSKNGLAPCSLCPAGSYQESDGMANCSLCQNGETTSASGSTSQAMCQSYDVLVINAEQDVSLGNITTAGNLSVLFWAKPFSDGSLVATSLKLVDEFGTLLTINVAPEIFVEAGESLLEASTLSYTKWSHVAVVWNGDASSIQMYVDGELKRDATVSLPKFSNGEIAIYSGDPEGIYLSGFQVLPRKVEETEISMLLNSCTERLEQAILTMDSFLGKPSSIIKIMTPATCDAVDECFSSPCGQHRCVNEIGNFTCICSQGMTGRLCDILMDHCKEHECKSGSSCVNHLTNYSCSCLEGYSGHFCEVPPVDGGWSDFGEWSSCSVTCDRGMKERNRTCNNPPPGLGGQNCIGSNVETEDCTDGPCKECSASPSRRFGIIPNCSTETGIRYCYPYCRDGTFMQPVLDTIETYKCGPNTDYQWTPLDWFPTCVTDDFVAPADMYSLETTVEFNIDIPSSSESDVMSKIKSNVLGIDCVNKALCDASVSLSNSGSRKKRGSGDTLQITFNIALETTGELRLDGYFTTGNISAGLQTVLDAIMSLELTAAELQANASAYFNVDSGGVMYSINDDSLTLTGIVDCPEGSVSDDGVCVECPVGTVAEYNYCVYCDVGYYQEETGQTICKQCPSGTTTAIIGGSDASNCTVETTATVSQDPSAKTSQGITPEDSGNETTNKTGIIVGVAIGTFVLVSAIIGSVLVLYKKYSRKHSRTIDQNGSFASLSMIRPDIRATIGPFEDGVANTRFTMNGHSCITPVEPQRSISPAYMDALKKELGDSQSSTKVPIWPTSPSRNIPPPSFKQHV